MHVIAAKAVAFGEALQPDFKTYAQEHRRERARRWRTTLKQARPRHRLGRHRQSPDAGRPAPRSARPARPPRRRSIGPRSPATRTASRSIRCQALRHLRASALGTPAGTTRGFGPAEFREIGGMIADVVEGLAQEWRRRRCPGRGAVANRVEALCAPLPHLSGAVDALPLLRP